MHSPLTRYGLPQVAAYPLLVLFVRVACFFLIKDALLIPVEVVFLLVFLWMLSFFRDPARTINADETVLLSPADGTIADIAVVDDSVLGKGALRIGVFLSIFNVHINRVPCSVRIEKVSYKKGQFKNAFSAQAGKINESNDILMVRLVEPKDRLLVRQISGAIARHIVCEAEEGAEYKQGEKFGMIKFGSRTELYLAAGSGYETAVKVGDKVQAGLSLLVKYGRYNRQ